MTSHNSNIYDGEKIFNAKNQAFMFKKEKI